MSLLSNARWIGSIQLARIFFQIAGLIIFARILDSNDFGVVAMATTVTNLALVFRDFGTGASVIQRESINDSFLQTVFSINFFIGFLIFAIIYLSAPAISIQIFKNDDLADTLRILAVTFPVASLGITHQAILERSNEFKKIAKIEISGSALGLLAGVSAAAFGMGANSIATQLVATSATITISLWIACKWRPSLKLRVLHTRDLLSFSGNLTAFNLVNYLSRNFDAFLIGRRFGTVVLGHYSMAYKLMLFPVQSLSYVATRSLYPVLSRNQNNPEEIASTYIIALKSVLLISAPVMAGLWAIRAPFIMSIFGQEWSPAIDILAWLAPVGLIQSGINTTGPIFMALNKTKLLLLLGVVGAVLMCTSFMIGSLVDLNLMIKLYLLANIVNMLVSFWLLSSTLKINPKKLLIAIRAPILAAFAMAAIINFLANSILQSFSPVTTLLTTIPTGILLYSIIVYKMAPNEMKNLAKKLKLIN